MSEKRFIANGAQVIGDVVLKEGVNIWYNTTVRGDHGRITIGEDTNIQDNVCVHTQIGHDMVIGKGVTVGHGAILHGEYIGDNTLIGMGAILLNGTKIGPNCIVGAGALVKQGMEVPEGKLLFGSPARIIRDLTPEEIEANRVNCREYLELSFGE